MSKVKELFGLSVLRDDVDWNHAVGAQHCPFSNTKCTKARKSSGSASIGVCTVNYGKHDYVMICPHRLMDGNKVFVDCIPLLTMHEPENELRLLPEVAIPGGNVDYYLVSAHNGKVVDFVGIELQTLDTSGSLWRERSLFLKSKGLDVGDDDLLGKAIGVNWKMSAKTILMQMHHKAQTFELLNKHLVLVIQDCFLDYMVRGFNFSRFRAANESDSVHIHSYDLRDTDVHTPTLALREMISTDADGMAQSLGLQADAKVGLDQMVGYLENRYDEMVQVVDSI